MNPPRLDPQRDARQRELLAITETVRNEALEEAARVVEEGVGPSPIAAKIRALKTSVPPKEG